MGRKIPCHRRSPRRPSGSSSGARSTSSQSCGMPRKYPVRSRRRAAITAFPNLLLQVANAQRGGGLRGAERPFQRSASFAECDRSGGGGRSGLGRLARCAPEGVEDRTVDPATRPRPTFSKAVVQATRVCRRSNPQRSPPPSSRHSSDVVEDLDSAERTSRPPTAEPATARHGGARRSIGGPVCPASISTPSKSKTTTRSWPAIWVKYSRRRSVIRAVSLLRMPRDCRPDPAQSGERRHRHVTARKPTRHTPSGRATAAGARRRPATTGLASPDRRRPPEPRPRPSGPGDHRDAHAPLRR